MSRVVTKALNYYQQNGFLRTLKKIVSYPFEERAYESFTSTLKDRSAQSVFVEIYEKNIWGNSESRSGDGSTLDRTESIRAHLPMILKQFKIKTFLDLPCGDFNWMSHVPLPKSVEYIGGDIVPQLIQDNEMHYEHPQRQFKVINLLEDSLPQADLLMCRDCLFHLSYADIQKAIRNILKANIPYLLTTTHLNKGKFVNTNIHTGNFRTIDLFAAPFEFPSEVLYRFDDYAEGDEPREMCLWRVEQLAQLPFIAPA